MASDKARVTITDEELAALRRCAERLRALDAACYWTQSPVDATLVQTQAPRWIVQSAREALHALGIVETMARFRGEG